jgi:Transposase DDE domain group 1
MADATGETKEPLRVTFDRRLKLELHGARITSDAGLLAYRELDDALSLTTMADSALAEGRRGKSVRHRLLSLLRQAVYGRLAGYEDVNDAERLARDPAMRAIVGREGPDRPAASTSEMGRFETEWLAIDANRTVLANLSGTWIDRVHERRHRTASSWIWIVPRARPTARRRARPGTATSAAPATTRCLSSISSATSSAACCGPATSTAQKAGARCCRR